MSFWEGLSGDLAKRRLFSQASHLRYACSVFLLFLSVEFLVELDVAATGLFSICAWFLFPVLFCLGEFCCVVSVVLRCVPGGGTPLYGLYGDVPLDKVWILASLS